MVLRMTIYKDRSITNDLLSKLELFEPKDKYEWPLTIEISDELYKEINSTR